MVPMDRRTFLGISGWCAATTGLLSAPASVRSDDDQTTDDALPSVGDDEDLWDEDHVEYGDEGPTVENLSIDGTFTVFEFSHDGSGNFIIELLDQAGEFEALVANEIGEIEGITGIGISGDDYQLDVTADGPWELRVAQPSPPDEEIHSPPAAANGETHDVAGPIELEGGETVAGSHQGEGNYMVTAWLEDATGLLDNELWMNEIGDHEGEVVNGLSGVSWIAIEADGTWELEIE